MKFCACKLKLEADVKKLIFYILGEYLIFLLNNEEIARV